MSYRVTSYELHKIQDAQPEVDIACPPSGEYVAIAYHPDFTVASGLRTSTMRFGGNDSVEDFKQGVAEQQLIAALSIVQICRARQHAQQAKNPWHNKSQVERVLSAVYIDEGIDPIEADWKEAYDHIDSRGSSQRGALHHGRLVRPIVFLPQSTYTPSLSAERRFVVQARSQPPIPSLHFAVTGLTDIVRPRFDISPR